jgi:hypothetical protein
LCSFKWSSPRTGFLTWTSDQANIPSPNATVAYGARRQKQQETQTPSRDLLAPQACALSSLATPDAKARFLAAPAHHQASRNSQHSMLEPQIPNNRSTGR